MQRILFVTSEAYPLIKTGGLADVSGALPRALSSLRQDLRLMLPAYPVVLERIGRTKEIGHYSYGEYRFRILQGTLPGTRVKCWLVECPELFGHGGNPYHDAHGVDWPDNDLRFGLFSKVAAEVAMGRVVDGWSAELLHCNDWQSALAPVYLRNEPQRPATLFTVHNLAYQGVFPYQSLERVGLPPELFHFEALEFYNRVAFIKGGLVYADHINTVSPGYAKEIQTPRFGHGLDGLLRHRADSVSGIINGIDTNEWNPGKDPHLNSHYNRRTLGHKQENKRALQQEMGLAVEDDTPLLGFVGRLVYQKGIDLLLDALPQLTERPLQLAVLGSGEAEQEQALRDWAEKLPDRIAVHIGYDEGLAHRIEAGADMFLMPSRYEPCGLNQMYSQRYGTIPVVRRVGGLADTVTDASDTALENDSATGFHIYEESPEALIEALYRALALYAEPQQWKRIQLSGMGRDFSWRASAEAYVALYRQLIIGS